MILRGWDISRFTTSLQNSLPFSNQLNRPLFSSLACLLALIDRNGFLSMFFVNKIQNICPHPPKLARIRISIAQQYASLCMWRTLFKFQVSDSNLFDEQVKSVYSFARKCLVLWGSAWFMHELSHSSMNMINLYMCVHTFYMRFCINLGVVKNFEFSF